MECREIYGLAKDECERENDDALADDVFNMRSCALTPSACETVYEYASDLNGRGTLRCNFCLPNDRGHKEICMQCIR